MTEEIRHDLWECDQCSLTHHCNPGECDFRHEDCGELLLLGDVKVDGNEISNFQEVKVCECQTTMSAGPRYACCELCSNPTERHECWQCTCATRVIIEARKRVANTKRSDDKY